MLSSAGLLLTPWNDALQFLKMSYLLVWGEQALREYQTKKRKGERGPLSRGVQARRQALRTRHTTGTEVRKKRPRGSRKRPRGFK